MFREPIAEIAELFHVYQSGLVFHAICAVARLEIPDRLADGPRPVSELAAEVTADPDALRRVLRLLDGYEIVTHHRETDRVWLTDRGELLRRDHPMSVWATFATLGVSDVAHRLVDTIRTGRPAVPGALGTGFWEYLADRPEQQAVFSQAMAEQARLLSLPCVPLLDWPDGGTVVDVGGGSGVLLAAVLDAAPGLKGILLDQPQVLPRAVERFRERGLADRADVRPHDLFTPVPAGDVYLLSRVLHDWDDDAVVGILGALARGASPGARLRIFEDLLPESGPLAATQAWSDVVMMVLYPGARERTLGQYRDLLARAGWAFGRTVAGPPGMHVIEASRSSDEPR
ncbi:methyltransferase [Micromonospora echinospora]|uniref:methyltransferase n=1 Tax=Micromonospora echinospora TaxID=1877 RepID=UPI0037A16A1A